MSIFANGLVAAMEDETQSAELAIDSTGADSAEADIVEATDISADVEAGTAEIDQASADAETLTRIADTAEAAEDDGGLDPVAAEVTEIAVEAIYARLGVKRTSYPALESFAGKTGRVRATQIAVEDIKETVKKIWAAVVVAFQKLVDFVKNFFAKIFDANRKLLARINALQKKVSATKTEPGGKVNAAGVIKDTEATDKGAAVKVLVATPSEMKAMVDASKDIAQGMVGFKEITNLLNNKSDVGLDALNIKSVQESFKKYSFLARDAEGTIGKKFEVSTTGDNNPDTKAPEFKFEMKNPFSSEGKELDALQLNQCKQVLSACEDIVHSNMQLKPVIATLESSMKTTIEAAKKVAETADTKDESNSNVAERSRIAQRLITSVGNSAIKAVTFTGKAAMNTAKVGIDYVERSLAASGKSGEATGDEEPGYKKFTKKKDDKK